MSSIHVEMRKKRIFLRLIDLQYSKDDFLISDKLSTVHKRLIHHTCEIEISNKTVNAVVKFATSILVNRVGLC